MSPDEQLATALRTPLREFIAGSFDRDDLQLFVGALAGVEWQELGGEENVHLRAQALVEKALQRGFLADLIERLADKRADKLREAMELIGLIQRLGEEREQAGRWDEAERLLLDSLCHAGALARETCDSLTHRRDDYRLATSKEDEREWDEATGLFGRLHEKHAGYRDVGRRLERLQSLESRYQEGERLWAARRWDESETRFTEIFEVEPRYKSCGERLETLAGVRGLAKQGDVLLEQRARFADGRHRAAVKKILDEIEARVPGYGDSTLHLRFLEALDAAAERRWPQAADLVRLLLVECPSYPGGADLLLLTTLVRDALAALAVGVAVDPGLPDAGEHPYRVYAAGANAVRRQTPIREIVGASLGSRMSPEVRRAFDDLRAPERRLLADALSLPVPAADRLADFLDRQTAERLALPSAAEIETGFPEQAAPALLLLGERAAAIRTLEVALREDPADRSRVHALAQLYLGWSEERCAAGSFDEESWRGAISHWVTLLADERYWQSWAEERAAAYGQSLAAGAQKELRGRLEELLAARVHACAESLSQDERVADLPLELEAERAVVRLLKRIGGLRAPEHGHLICGYRLLRRLGLADQLAALVATETENPKSIEEVLAGAPSESDIRRLRQLCSSLRKPAILLEGARRDAQRVLDILAAEQCTVCHDCPCPLHGRTTPEIWLCCDRCTEFGGRNPAYRALQAPGEWIHEDAQRLAAEAYLRRAEQRGESLEEPDVRLVRRNWGDALALSRFWSGEAEVVESIRGSAVAVATRLAESDRQADEAAALDRAISVLRAAVEVAGGEGQLTLQLAQQLTRRGIARANAHALEGAVEDLEAAFGLAPHVARIRDQYATALAWRGEELGKEEPAAGEAMLDVAEKLIRDGLSERPDEIRYLQTLQLIDLLRAGLRDERPGGRTFEVLEELLGGAAPENPAVKEARRARGEGDVEAALTALWNAWEQDPGDGEVRDGLVEALYERAGELLEAGNGEGHERFVEHAVERVAGHAETTARVGSLYWGSKVRHDLKQTGLKHRCTASMGIMIPFASNDFGTVMVRLGVKGELVHLLGPLPSVAEREETLVLADLLEATSRLMFFRVSEIDRVGLAFECCMPARYLDSERLECLVRSLDHFADVPPGALRSAAQLRAHLDTQEHLLQISWPRGSSTLDDLRHLCGERGWPTRSLDGGRAGVQPPGAPSLVAEVGKQGLRLLCELGRLPAAEAEPLRRMTRRNSRLGLGKLSLTERRRLLLLCDLPSLDEQGLDAAAALFAQQGEALRREFTGG